MPFFHFETDEFFTNVLFYDFCIDSIESLWLNGNKMVT